MRINLPYLHKTPIKAQLYILIIALFCAGACLCPTGAAAQIKSPAKAAEKTKFDSTLFTDVNKLGQSDYLAALQRVFDIQNKVPAISNSFSGMDEINKGLLLADSAIGLVQNGLSPADSKSVNLQDLQMFNRLLEELNDNNEGYKAIINEYDKNLTGLKKEILDIRKDTVLRHIFSNHELRTAFAPQIEELKGKWAVTDSLVQLNTTALNNVKTHTSRNSISVNELLFKTGAALKTAGSSVFKKEHRYLWQPRTINAAGSATSFKREVDTENKISAYYFKNVKGNRYLLWLLSVVFFLWAFFNFKRLKRLNKLSAIKVFDFKYITPHPFLASLVFILCLAPLFDMDAPVVYTDYVAFASVITLTLFFIKRLPHPFFYIWCGYVVLFLMLPLLDLLDLPFYIQRWWMLAINIASVAYSFFVAFLIGKKAFRFRYIFLTGILYIFFNFLSLVCNLFGRVTLAQIFYSTAAYAFAQVIALTVLVKIMVEAFLLQIAASRARKGYPDDFEHHPVIKGVARVASLAAVICWLVVFADNLNIYDAIIDGASAVLGTAHSVGSFSFTFGGVVLFTGIIWAANFLQKNIGGFFGDIGDDVITENKTERSRLLVTRLILLIIGFLLAVAALGLPVEQITVILGALGIGIGLGLQNIVNNFVSGVILIFDRTLRIGDIVELSDKRGRVKEIGIRASTLLTEDGAEIVIPNGDILSKNIINWTLSNNLVRVAINLQAARPFNLDDIAAICNREIQANKNVYASRPPEIYVTSITAASENIKILFWCNNISETEKTFSELNTAIYEKLGDAGIKLL